SPLPHQGPAARVPASSCPSLLPVFGALRAWPGPRRPPPWLSLSPPLPTPLSPPESSANGSRAALTLPAIHRHVGPCQTPDPPARRLPRPPATAALLPPPTALLSRTSGRNSSPCALTRSP